MAHKMPTTHVGCYRPAVLDGGSTPPISTSPADRLNLNKVQPVGFMLPHYRTSARGSARARAHHQRHATDRQLRSAADLTGDGRRHCLGHFRVEHAGDDEARVQLLVGHRHHVVVLREGAVAVDQHPGRLQRGRDVLKEVLSSLNLPFPESWGAAFPRMVSWAFGS